MRSTRSIHLGVDAPAGAGLPRLRSAEKDALALAALCARRGYVAATMLGGAATREAALRAIHDAVARLSPGMHLLVTFAGHGVQLADRDGDEADGLDEAWCLADGPLRDDDLAEAWMALPEGSAAYVVADSCHAGTSGLALAGAGPVVLANALPPDLAPPSRRRDRRPAGGAVACLGACPEGGLAGEDDAHGRFTGALLEALARSPEHWVALREDVARRLGPDPVVDLSFRGPGVIRALARPPFVPGRS